ncbi:hypothetical protein IPL68_07160 [Candidatus Saccharibacteria bacterium]|nr:MAG: hypothetical protein IPL68_07160 [Candidatus Saccharibacteria bacterium]
MRKRIFGVLAILLIFRILAHIPVPLADPETLKQVLTNLFSSQDTPQLLSFINVLSGGALANFSIMIAGLGPYINASIIMQLLTKALPKLEKCVKMVSPDRSESTSIRGCLPFPGNHTGYRIDLPRSSVCAASWRHRRYNGKYVFMAMGSYGRCTYRRLYAADVDG